MRTKRRENIAEKNKAQHSKGVALALAWDMIWIFPAIRGVWRGEIFFLLKRWKFLFLRRRTITGLQQTMAFYSSTPTSRPLGLKRCTETIQLWDLILVSAGVRGTQVILRPEDYLRATGAMLADIARGKK